jgi:hypothetical protein
MQRLSGYSASTLRSGISSHTLSGPITLIELDAINRFGTQHIAAEGLRVAALNGSVVISSELKPTLATLQTERSSISFWSKMFKRKPPPAVSINVVGKVSDGSTSVSKKRTRGEEELCVPEGLSKRQTKSIDRNLESTVQHAMHLAHTTAEEKTIPISENTWLCAQSSVRAALSVHGVGGELVCQGTCINVNRPSMSPGIPPMVVSVRLCGGVAIFASQILDISKHSASPDGSLRPLKHTCSDGVDRINHTIPQNIDGVVQQAVGNSSILLEVAIPVV